MSTIIEISPKLMEMYGTPFIEIAIKSYDATTFTQNEDLVSSIPGARLGYGYGFLTAYPHAEFDPIDMNYIYDYKEESYLTYGNGSILGGDFPPPPVYLHPVPEPSGILIILIGLFIWKTLNSNL